MPEQGYCSCRAVHVSPATQAIAEQQELSAKVVLLVVGVGSYQSLLDVPASTQFDELWNFSFQFLRLEQIHARTSPSDRTGVHTCNDPLSL